LPSNISALNRPQIEKIFRRDLARHDRVLNILAAEKILEAVRVGDAHPLEDISRIHRELDQFRHVKAAATIFCTPALRAASVSNRG
jgi:hypothetical protein